MTSLIEEVRDYAAIKKISFVCENNDENIELICEHYGVGSVDELTLMKGASLNWEYGNEVRFIETLDKVSNIGKVRDLCNALGGKMYLDYPIIKFFECMDEIDQARVGFSIVNTFGMNNPFGVSHISVFVYCE